MAIILERMLPATCAAAPPPPPPPPDPSARKETILSLFYFQLFLPRDFKAVKTIITPCAGGRGRLTARRLRSWDSRDTRSLLAAHPPLLGSPRSSRSGSRPGLRLELSTESPSVLQRFEGKPNWGPTQPHERRTFCPVLFVCLLKTRMWLDGRGTQTGSEFWSQRSWFCLKTPRDQTQLENDPPHSGPVCWLGKWSRTAVSG